MPEHAFVAALLKMAAEERLKAESARNMIEPAISGLQVPWYIKLCQQLDQEFEATAQGAEGRAEVYERFANRIIGDIAGELLLTQVEKEFPPLSGSAEISFEFKMDDYRRPLHWHWPTYRILPLQDPNNWLITGLQ